MCDAWGDDIPIFKVCIKNLWVRFGMFENSVRLYSKFRFKIRCTIFTRFWKIFCNFWEFIAYKLQVIYSRRTHISLHQKNRPMMTVSITVSKIKCVGCVQAEIWSDLIRSDIIYKADIRLTQQILVESKFTFLKQAGASGHFLSPIPTQNNFFQWGLIDQCEKFGRVFYHRQRFNIASSKNKSYFSNDKKDKKGY